MKERVEAARRHLQMAIDWKGEILVFLKPDVIIQIILKAFRTLKNIE